MYLKDGKGVQQIPGNSNSNASLAQQEREVEQILRTYAILSVDPISTKPLHHRYIPNPGDCGPPDTSLPLMKSRKKKAMER